MIMIEVLAAIGLLSLSLGIGAGIHFLSKRYRKVKVWVEDMNASYTLSKMSRTDLRNYGVHLRKIEDRLDEKVDWLHKRIMTLETKYNEGWETWEREFTGEDSDGNAYYYAPYIPEGMDK